MDDEKKVHAFIQKMRATKAPTKLPTLMRKTSFDRLVFVSGEQVDEEFQDGLFRHLSAGGRGLSRQTLLKTVDAASIGDFALKVFELWEGAKYHGRHNWVLDLIALCGDERSAIKLERLIQDWQHNGNTWRKRAISSMSVFRQMGSDTALMALVGFTHRQDVPSVYETAVRELTRVAGNRRMGWHHLSDSVIPDCGLDERGTRTFDLGGRVLTVALDAEFEPVLRDDTRKTYRKFPTGASGDDSEKLAAAQQEWSLMQAKLHDVIRIQTRRMEEVMITGRTWPVSVWRALILEHPLMTNFARRLVWGYFDEERNLLATFRASTDDATLIDVEDESVELGEAGSIGLLHPVQMSATMRQLWADSFADYEVFSPFDQLGRQVFEVPEMGAVKSFVPDQSVAYTSKALREVMKREGWRREASGGYTRRYFFKKFDGYEHVMYVDLTPGLTAGGEAWDPDQHVTAVRGNKVGAKKETPVQVKKLPAVCFSEALRFLSQVEEQQA